MTNSKNYGTKGVDVMDVIVDLLSEYELVVFALILLDCKKRVADPIVLTTIQNV